MTDDHSPVLGTRTARQGLSTRKERAGGPPERGGER